MHAVGLKQNAINLSFLLMELSSQSQTSAGHSSEGGWRGCKPDDEPWRPDHFAFKWSNCGLTCMGEDAKYRDEHVFLFVNVQSQILSVCFKNVISACKPLYYLSVRINLHIKSCQSNFCLATDDGPVMECLKGIVIRSWKSNISTISLSSGGRPGQTMEIRLGTWEPEHDVTDMSWHYWTVCRAEPSPRVDMSQFNISQVRLWRSL